MPHNHGREDPYDKFSRKYDLNTVDYWLSLHTDKGELEDWFGIKDDKIVDGNVVEIVKEYLPPV